MGVYGPATGTGEAGAAALACQASAAPNATVAITATAITKALIVSFSMCWTGAAKSHF
jgi:hypothetical protein